MHPPVLNELKDGEEGSTDDASNKSDDAEGSDSSESQTDDADASEDDSTPAGKKFAKMRADKKELQSQIETERMARIRAEARAEAIAEERARNGKQEEPAKKPESIHPDDLSVIRRGLRELGIDPDGLKDLQSLPKATQQMVAEQQIDRAASTLKDKYADSVPFDKSKAIKYAVENKLGLAMPNAPFEKILEIAHKEMNEEALADWRYEQRTKGKKAAPKISDNGTGKKEVREEKPHDSAGYRRLANQIVGE